MKIRAKPVVRHRLVRLFIAHLLCAIHIGLSIYVIYTIKARTQFYFIPLIGCIFFAVEAIVSFLCYGCKEYFRGFSILLFVYSISIIASIWVLELHRIHELKQDSWKTVVISFYNYPFRFGEPQGANMKPREILQNFKYIWSEIEIQVYLFLLLILRALLPKQDSISYFGKTDILFKYFATGMDLLDLIGLLAYPQLYTNPRLVYATLSVWSVGCLQFVIYIPEAKDDKLKELHSFLSNSLLTVFLMDTPFLIVRLYTIFGCGKHDYTSYFFVFKNIVLILLQIARIQAIITERNQHRKSESSSMHYIPKIPFDTRLKNCERRNERQRSPVAGSGKNNGARIVFTDFSQSKHKTTSGKHPITRPKQFSLV